MPPMLEILMRYTPMTCALALAFACVSSVATGQAPEAAIDADSIALLRQGETLAAAGNYQGANDAIEAALVADPRNRAAYVALARVAQKQELQGKAIRLYREALKIEPNDRDALAGQGEAMVAKGAVEKAKENLARLKTICLSGCTEQTELAAAIARGPSPQVLTAKSVVPEPVVTPAENN